MGHGNLSWQTMCKQQESVRKFYSGHILRGGGEFIIVKMKKAMAAMGKDNFKTTSH